MLRIVAFCVGLIIALPAAWADAWEECYQWENSDLRIKGCSEIINKGGETQKKLGVAYENRGYAYDDKHEYDKAIADYTKAIEIDPNDFIALNNRAAAYLEAGKAAQGLPDAEKAVELNPNDPAFRATRGQIFEALGRREEAIADYRRSLKQQESKDGLKRLGVTP